MPVRQMPRKVVRPKDGHDAMRPMPQDGDAISCPSENANIRRAYREEAIRAGADAPKL